MTSLWNVRLSVLSHWHVVMYAQVPVIPALKEDFINHVTAHASASWSADTSVGSLVLQNAPPARRNVRTTVSTAGVKRNVERAVFHVLSHASGGASTTSVPISALNHAIGLAAMYHVLSYCPVVIPVLDCVESPAQRSALFATMRNSPRSFLALRKTQMLDLYSLKTVAISLSPKALTIIWMKMMMSSS